MVAHLKCHRSVDTWLALHYLLGSTKILVSGYRLGKDETWE